MANTSLPIRSGLTGASNGLEVDDNIVTEYLAFCHNIEVVAVAVVVFGADGGAPDFVTVVRAEVGDHDNDAFARNTTFTAAIASRCAGRGQVVAFTAAAATP